MYQLRSKVRYSEANAKAALTCHALLNYLQDASTLHSEELGESGAELREKKMAWVLSFWQICIDKMPKLSEDITVSTWPYSTKGLLGLRNFCLHDAAGECLVKANSIWVLVDPDTGKIVRITDEVSSHYPDEPKLEGDRIVFSYAETAQKVIVPLIIIQSSAQKEFAQHWQKWSKQIKSQYGSVPEKVRNNQTLDSAPDKFRV